jgi:hypothetical protein
VVPLRYRWPIALKRWTSKEGERVQSISTLLLGRPANDNYPAPPTDELASIVLYDRASLWVAGICY